MKHTLTSLAALAFLVIPAVLGASAEAPRTTTGPASDLPPLMLNLVFRQDQNDPEADSGIWWSWRDNPEYKPRVEIAYCDGQRIIRMLQHGRDGSAWPQTTYVKKAGLDPIGSGRSEGHKHNILAKKTVPRVGFLKCDLSFVPRSAQIERVTLHLRLHPLEGLGHKIDEGSIGVYEGVRDWNWDAMNWTEFDTGKNWSTPGGDIGPKVREIRIQDDLRAHGWGKNKPETQFDFTEHVRVLHARRVASTAALPDRFTPARAIGPGTQPRLTIDYARQRLHLIMVEGDTLLHRVGTLEGVFEAPEKVMSAAKLWDPSVAVDADGDVHIAVANGHTGNRYTWYMNRKGGTWKTPLVVVDNTVDGTNRATTPHLHLHGDSAYVAVFTVGLGPKLGEQWGLVARIENLSDTPRVAVKRLVDPWNPQVFVTDGALWVGGRNRAKARRRFTFQAHDPLTLAERGELMIFHAGEQGEMARGSMDARGDLHAAGALNDVPFDQAGWYNSLSRVQARKPAIAYRTTNLNAHGAALPVRDRKAADRVYIVHWSGGQAEQATSAGGKARPHDRLKPCAPDNQIRFARVEHGERVTQEQLVTDRPGAHGDSHRQTPAAVAHPEGGLLIVFEECNPTPTLFLTHVGRMR